jgi:hypothetical protein
VEKPIIFRLTTEQKKFLNHFARFGEFINHFMMGKEEGAVYVEFLENGIAYTIKDILTLEKLTKPIASKNDLDFDPEQNFIDKLVLKILYPKKEFPPEGFRMVLDFLNNEVEISKILQQYFKSISTEIGFQRIEGNKFELFFPTYTIFMRYVNAFAINYKIINQEFSQKELSF